MIKIQTKVKLKKNWNETNWLNQWFNKKILLTKNKMNEIEENEKKKQELILYLYVIITWKWKKQILLYAK